MLFSLSGNLFDSIIIDTVITISSSIITIFITIFITVSWFYIYDSILFLVYSNLFETKDLIIVVVGNLFGLPY